LKKRTVEREEAPRAEVVAERKSVPMTGGTVRSTKSKEAEATDAEVEVVEGVGGSGPSEGHGGSDAPVLVDHSNPLEAFFDRYKGLLSLLFLAGVLAAMLFFFLKHKSEQGHILAAQEYSAASSPEQYDEIISKHSGSLVAGNALLRKAQLALASGKNEEAEKSFSNLLADYSNHPRAAQAAFAMGNLAENAGDHDKALSYYRKLTQGTLDSELAPLARLREADVLLAKGEEDQARQIYERVAAEYPVRNRPFAQRIEGRLELLPKKEGKEVKVEKAEPMDQTKKEMVLPADPSPVQGSQ